MILFDYTGWEISSGMQHSRGEFPWKLNQFHGSCSFHFHECTKKSYPIFIYDVRWQWEWIVWAMISSEYSHRSPHIFNKWRRAVSQTKTEWFSPFVQVPIFCSRVLTAFILLDPYTITLIWHRFVLSSCLCIFSASLACYFRNRSSKQIRKANRFHHSCTSLNLVWLRRE